MWEVEHLLYFVAFHVSWKDLVNMRLHEHEVMSIALSHRTLISFYQHFFLFLCDLLLLHFLIFFLCNVWILWVEIIYMSFPATSAIFLGYFLVIYHHPHRSHRCTHTLIHTFMHTSNCICPLYPCYYQAVTLLMALLLAY